MADTTEISWTDSTMNPVIGCTAISEGCINCYAESMNAHRKWTTWGPHGTRRVTSDATWANPLKWQANASKFQAAHGHRQRVFCASLSDVFDNKWPLGVRDRLWALIRATPDLDWQLLTKRPENIARFLPADWGDGYPNVWLGTTTENQETYDRRWSVLWRIPARVRFLSYEPALGPIHSRWEIGCKPDWVIFGGESGRHARDCDSAWARLMRDACMDAGVAFFLKQWGHYGSNPWVVEHGCSLRDAATLDPICNGKGGGLLDGRLHRNFPRSHL